MPQDFSRLPQVLGVEGLVNVLVIEIFQLVKGDLELLWREGGRGGEGEEWEGRRDAVSIGVCAFARKTTPLSVQRTETRTYGGMRLPPRHAVPPKQPSSRPTRPSSLTSFSTPFKAGSTSISSSPTLWGGTEALAVARSCSRAWRRVSRKVMFCCCCCCCWFGGGVWLWCVWGVEGGKVRRVNGATRWSAVWCSHVVPSRRVRNGA